MTIGRRLEGRVAIVTGAARGIGRAIATRIAIEGAAVAIVDLRIEQARATAAEIEAKGGRALALEADVARLDELDRMAATTQSAFGAIDILCNNAGVSGGSGDFFAHTEADW